MKIYNRELTEIQDEETKTRIEQIIRKQIEFLVSTYGIDRQMLEDKLENLSIVEYSKKEDKTYFKKVNKEIRELPIGDKVAAFCGQIEQNYTDNRCLLNNAVFIDKSFSNLAFEHTFSHEFFHYLSDDTEMTLNDNNEAMYKSGINIGKYDKDDNLISEDSRGLNEGITELLAVKQTGVHGGEYNIPVKIADILIGNNNKSLINAYFSGDKSQIQKFYDDFDKRQTSTSSEQLKSIPSKSSYFTLDVNLLKGCIEYTISFCKNMEELTAERKRLLPIFKSMRDDLNFEYSEENFDVKELFDSVMSEKRKSIQSKSTQELGRETLDVQKETDYIDSTQESIEKEQKSIEDKDKNTQELQ